MIADSGPKYHSQPSLTKVTWGRELSSDSAIAFWLCRSNMSTVNTSCAVDTFCFAKTIRVPSGEMLGRDSHAVVNANGSNPVSGNHDRASLFRLGAMNRTWPNFDQITLVSAGSSSCTGSCLPIWYTSSG